MIDSDGRHNFGITLYRTALTEIEIKDKLLKWWLIKYNGIAKEEETNQYAKIVNRYYKELSNYFLICSIIAIDPDLLKLLKDGQLIETIQSVSSKINVLITGRESLHNMRDEVIKNLTNIFLNIERKGR